MTEYELADVAGSYSVGGMTAISLYLTIVTAYLVTAFVAGRRLDSTETFIVTTLFIFSASFFVFGTIAFFTRQAYIIEKLAAIETDSTFYASKSAAVYIAVVEILGIVASLKFMWNVRRRGPE